MILRYNEFSRIKFKYVFTFTLKYTITLIQSVHVIGN